MDTWNSTVASNTSPELLNSAENQVSFTENPDLKQGIKLSNSSREWKITKDFQIQSSESTNRRR